MRHAVSTQNFKMELRESPSEIDRARPLPLKSNLTGLEKKNRLFINCHPPLPAAQKNPFKIPKDPPLLVSECIGVHSTMERPVLASFWGRDGGFWGRVRVAIYEDPGFPNPGFCNL